MFKSNRWSFFYCHMNCGGFNVDAWRLIAWLICVWGWPTRIFAASKLWIDLQFCLLRGMGAVGGRWRLIKAMLYSCKKRGESQVHRSTLQWHILHLEPHILLQCLTLGTYLCFSRSSLNLLFTLALPHCLFPSAVSTGFSNSTLASRFSTSDCLLLSWARSAGVGLRVAISNDISRSTVCVQYHNNTGMSSTMCMWQ